MADNTYFYGFRWYASLNGATTPTYIPCRVASGFTPTAGATCHLRPGDPVILLSTGYIRDCAAGEACVYGVVSGIVKYYDGSKMRTGPYLPYGTTYTAGEAQESTVMVIPAQGNLFEVCCDEATPAAGNDTRAEYLAKVGLNCDHSYALLSAPSLNPALDISTSAAASGQWRIYDLSRDPACDYTGAYPSLIVMANEFQGPVSGSTAYSAT